MTSLKTNVNLGTASVKVVLSPSWHWFPLAPPHPVGTPAAHPPPSWDAWAGAPPLPSRTQLDLNWPIWYYENKKVQIVWRWKYHLQYCCGHLLISLTRNTRNHAGGDILLISWHVLDKIKLYDLLITFRYSQCRASSSWFHHQYNRGGRACFSYAGPSWTFWIE